MDSVLKKGSNHFSYDRQQSQKQTVINTMLCLKGNPYAVLIFIGKDVNNIFMVAIKFPSEDIILDPFTTKGSFKSNPECRNDKSFKIYGHAFRIIRTGF